jgi:predicted Zn finger-like uncharacterized protein
MYSGLPESRPHSDVEDIFSYAVSLRYKNYKIIGDTAHMVKAQLWSDEEVERLRELYTSNKTFDEIAEKFPKRTDNAIRLKASRLGIRRPYYNNIVQVKPLVYKSGKGDQASGYLIKCKECGSWIQVDASDQSHDRTVLTCAKCGNYYNVVTDL